MSERAPTRFGLIYTYMDGDRTTTTDPARKANEVHYAEILDHMVWAEEIGFDSIWLTEHHFDTHTPSPLILASALAQRTQRVRISSNVMLAPLYHPIRLAEEAAMVSVLSNGRYDLGIGMGYHQIEFDALGVNIRNRPSLLEDGVEIMRRAWTGEPFSYDGKRFQVPAVAVTPAPTTPPRILIGGLVDVAIKRAARIGDGFLAAFNDHVDAYVDELDRLGRTGTVCCGQQSVVAEDAERAIAELEPYILRYVNDTLDRGLYDLPHFETAKAAVESGLYTVWDGPTAVEQIGALLERHPIVEDVHFMVSSGPGEPLESTRPRVEFLANEVLPRLREGAVASAGGE